MQFIFSRSLCILSIVVWFVQIMSAQSVWERLGPETFGAYRFHLQDETIARYQDRYPELGQYWSSIGERLNQYIGKLYEKDRWMEDFRNDYALDLAELLEDMKGELGLAILTTQSEEKLSLFYWMVPDKSAATVYNKVGRLAEQLSSDSPEVHRLEKRSFAGGEAQVFLSVRNQEENQEGVLVRAMALVIHEDTLYLAPFTRDMFMTTLGAWHEVEIVDADLEYVGRVIRGEDRGGFVSRIRQNPGYDLEELDKFWEVGMDFAFIKHAIIGEQGEMVNSIQSREDVQIWELVLSTLNWLKITGLEKADSVYWGMGFSSMGMSEVLGVGGSFANAGEDNLLKVYSTAPKGGLSLLSWFPDTMKGFEVGGLRFPELYRLLMENMELRLGSQWQQFSEALTTAIRSASGYELSDLFEAFGSRVYRVEGLYGESAAFVEVENSGVLSWLVSQVSWLRKYLEMSGAHVDFRKTSMLNYQGWSVVIAHDEKSINHYLLHNDRYLVYGRHEDFMLEILNLLNRQEGLANNYFELPIIKDTLERWSVLSEVKLSEGAYYKIELPDYERAAGNLGIHFGMILGDLDVRELKYNLYLYPLLDIATERSGLRISFGRVTEGEGFVASRLLRYAERE